MPILKTGWEFHIVRTKEQSRASDGKIRTVGTYAIFHDGVAQTATDLSGTVAETRGPGANAPAGNNRRVEAGRYPLLTQAGTKYVTLNYSESGSTSATPKPGLELGDTGKRKEILIHPGRGFLSSIGCINPCTSLPKASELITYSSSRRRVISIIDDLKAFLADKFPKSNGKKIPNAFVVIDGEP
jgi:hypothetical protein